jgi:phosphatidylglycerophosphatase A
MAGNYQGAAPVPWRDVLRSAPLATALATWFGAGFLPIAPGTWGSLFAIPFVEAAFRVGGLPGLAGFAAATSLAGIPAAGAVARLRRQGDPSAVVVDEVAGQAIALLPVYAFARGGSALRFWILVAVAFFLFRAVDVLKPGPVGKAERLPGGLGVMADDLLGGTLVALLLAGFLIVVR